MKDKVIEEMARNTCTNYRKYNEKHCLGYKICDCNCAHYNRCETLYNAGYRKVHEDSVVLTMEEYEHLCDLAYFGSGEEEIRKATSEKFAKLIFEKFSYDKLTHEPDEDIEIHLTASELFELAKHFGVEVKV